MCLPFVISLTPSKQLEFILITLLSKEPGAIIHEAAISEELVNRVGSALVSACPGDLRGQPGCCSAGAKAAQLPGSVCPRAVAFRVLPLAVPGASEADT